MSTGRLWTGLLMLVAVALSVSELRAQSFGIELHNNVMPASGGMAGASLSRPQDLQSAINGNPATLTQFHGTQFSFGGAWMDANYKVTQSATLPIVGVTPFSAQSDTLGALAGNIGVTQDFSALGLPVTVGLGFISNAGAGVDFRAVPASNGTSAQYLALDMISAVGANVTDRLSVGAAFVLGSSFLDGPFVDVGGMVPAYAPRGTVGVNYLLRDDTSLGVYWQSKKSFTFDNAVLFPGGATSDVEFDHPQNLGFGIANSSLMEGNLLLAVDALYKNHESADFLKAIYDNQWCFQFGAQYTVNPRMKVRLGYAFNQNPMSGPTVTSIGGVSLPDGIPGARYVQGQFAAITQHRLTCGLGLTNVLPGVDLDLFGGATFDESDQFATTTTSIDGNYWVGTGLTWRFGGG